MSLSIKQVGTKTIEQEALVFDRWHNTVWHQDYIKRINGVMQEEEYVTKIYAEYVPFADDSNGKRHFKYDQKQVKEFVYEDLIRSLPPEKQQLAFNLVASDYQTDIFILKDILGLDVELEVD